MYIEFDKHRKGRLSNFVLRMPVIIINWLI